MTMSNPYDLGNTNRTAGTKAAKAPPREYTGEEVDELLQGYHAVPSELWDKIAAGTHIRLRRNDGKFLRGGFVRNHWTNSKGERVTTVKTGFDERASDYRTFNFVHNKIERIWKKDDGTIVSVADFADIARQIMERVEKLEKDMSRLTKIVGMLAEKKR